MISNEWRGILYAIASGLFFGALGYFAMGILQADISIPNMLFWRFFIAGLFMTVISYSVLKRQSYRDLFNSFLLCAVFYSSSTALYFLSSTYIGTGLAMVIFFTFPVFVIFLSWLLYKQKISLIYYVAIGFILLGLALLSHNNEVTLDLIGISLAIFSAVLYAIYLVASKKQAGLLHPMLLTLMVCYSCSFVFFNVSIFHGSFVVPQTLVVWGHVIGLAIICTALPILFTLYGLKYISAAKTSILSVLEPVIVVIIGVLFLEEAITLKQVIGVVIILAAAILVQCENLPFFKKPTVSYNTKRKQPQ